jgi:squalene synthase HpnD
MNEVTTQAETMQAGASSRASGSSFYTAMRILPRGQRDAMFEIYSFCRLVDDVADSNEPRSARRQQLAEWRSKIEAIYAGNPSNGLAPLAAAVRKFALRKADFLAIIDGMEMDAEQDIRAPDWQTLDLYCDRVASAVGRLSVRVFGMSELDGTELARHLGRALQLTNILRDLDEDAEIGRLYLPQEALEEAGIASNDPQIVLASPALPEVCMAVVARAREHFRNSDAIMARSQRRVVRAPRIMGQVYRHILEGMVERGWVAPRRRVRVGGLRLSWIALQYAIV